MGLGTNNLFKFAIGSWVMQLMIVMVFTAYANPAIDGQIAMEQQDVLNQLEASGLIHDYNELENDTTVSSDELMQEPKQSGVFDELGAILNIPKYLFAAIKVIGKALMPGWWLARQLGQYGTGLIYTMLKVVLYIWQAIIIFLIAKLVIKPERFS